MNYNYLFWFLSALVLTSCEGEKVDHSIINRSINVNAHIKGVSTRATNNGWENGDAIGIYMKTATQALSTESALAKNAQYVTQGDGSFTAKTTDDNIKYPLEGTTVDFIAYYPQGKVGTSFDYSINVSDQSSQAAIDVLYSDNVTGKSMSAPTISLQFSHKLSKLVFDISSSVSNTDLSGLKAKLVGLNPRGKMSLINGTVSSTTTKGDIRLKVSADGKTAEAIVLPTADLTGKKLIIESGAVGYEYDLGSAENIDKFESGYQYTYSITLIPTATFASVLATASVLDWVSGPSETVTLNKSYNTYQPIGAGTQENPYTIADAKSSWSVSDVWVKGYIVGYYTTSKTSGFSTDLSNMDKVKESSLAIASSPTETEGANTFPIELPTGNVREKLNLKSNPSNLGKEVKIKGDIESYYGTVGVKDASNFEFISTAP